MRRLRRAIFSYFRPSLVGLPTGLGATPGPGGWDNLGTGTGPATAALNGAVYSLNSDAPGACSTRRLLHRRRRQAGRGLHREVERRRLERARLFEAERRVHAIAYHAGKVYVGGVFTNAGGNPNADFLAVWDGTKWGTPCNATGPAFGGNVNALQIIGSTLYVGGSFANGAGIASADYLLACDLNTGAASSTVAADGDLSGSMYALTADSKGALYAGGGFSNLEGIPAADDVAYYVGGAWHAMGSGPLRPAARSRGSSAASPQTGRRYTSARIPSTSRASRRPITSSSGTARPGAQSARTPAAETAGSRLRASSTRSRPSAPACSRAGRSRTRTGIRLPISSPGSTARPGTPSGRTAPGTVPCSAMSWR